MSNGKLSGSIHELNSNIDEADIRLIDHLDFIISNNCNSITVNVLSNNTDVAVYLIAYLNYLRYVKDLHKTRSWEHHTILSSP